MLVSYTWKVLGCGLFKIVSSSCSPSLSLLISLRWSDLPFLRLLHPKAQQHGPRGLLMTTYWYDHCQHESEKISWQYIINDCILCGHPVVRHLSWGIPCSCAFTSPCVHSWPTGPGQAEATHGLYPRGVVQFPIFFTGQKRYMEYIPVELYGYDPGGATIGNVNSRCKRRVCHSITITLWSPTLFFIISSIISFIFPNLPFSTSLAYCRVESIILVFIRDDPISPLREAVAE